MSAKRRVSIFIPLKKKENSISIFLQKRSEDAERLPGYFGFWGGGCEADESFEQGLIREVKEELGVVVKETEVEFFNHYEFLRTLANVYIYYPTETWEDTIKIGEGEFGKWFSPEETYAASDIIFSDKAIINDLEIKLLGKRIK